MQEYGLPQGLVSAHAPSVTQLGPATENRQGAFSRERTSICLASSRISHCARLQSRREKK